MQFHDEEETVMSASIPSREEIVKAAQALVPTLRDRAQDTEDLRRIPDETIADLRKAGLHKLFVPKRYGGFEMPWGTHVDVSRTLGQGCGSTGWVSSVVLTHTFLFGRFEEEAQDDVWGDNPDAIISTGFAGGGQATPTDGGFHVSGRWKFASGVDHADAMLVGAKLPNSKAAFNDLWIVLKKNDFEILDTWQSEGLRGTGSKDIKVDNVFVPTHRTLDMKTMAEDPPGAKLHEYYLYGVEFHSYFITLLAGPILGAARGAYNEYVGQTMSRVGAMMGESIIDQPAVQVHVAESLTELETADMLIDNLCDRLHTLGMNGESINGEFKLRAYRDLVMAGKLAHSSADRLSRMMGVSAQTGRNAVQRLYRDVRTMSTHSALHWEAGLQRSGKYIFGLPTGDPKIDGETKLKQAAE
jgi:3-hydroxy-9,10-secoandrosta-1,3,5(10)-triene-9,17-dione monooxygenase